MSYFKHLKPREYYENLYDEMTVRECHFFEQSFLDDYPQVEMIEFRSTEEERTMEVDLNKKEKEKKEEVELSDEEKEFRTRYAITRLALYYKSAHRAANRREKIDEWIQRDTLKDEKRANLWEVHLENSRKRCRQCGDLMKCFNKDFHDIGDQEDRILFMYECVDSNCKYREAEFENGELWKPEKSKCPECGSCLEESSKRLKTKIKHYSKCPNCDFKDVWEIDLNKKPKKKTKEELESEKLMERDKLRFCLSEKEGAEFKESYERIKRFNESVNREKELEKTGESYQQIKQLEKLTLLEAQKQIKEGIKGKKFLKLKFGEPDMGRDVVFEFKLYEGNPERSESKATKELKKLIIKALDQTNWKLMSDGISSRLGIYSGRIRSIEYKRF